MLESVIVVNVVISLAVLIGGYYLKYHAKPYADSLIGFKTKRATASDEAWQFANRKCGRLWFAIGVFGFAATGAVAVYILPKWNNTATVSVYVLILILQIAATVASVFHVEEQLKIKFGDQS